jgi:acyl-CoA hydrolase
VELTSLLSNAHSRVADACFITSFVPGINSRCLARPGHRSRMAVFFMQPSLRAALAEGRIDFRPSSYFGIHQFLADPGTRIDTAVVQVTPPDQNGLCSLGPAVEFMPTVIKQANRLFGVINPLLPRLAGSVSVPIDQFELIAHSNTPLATYDVGEASPAAGRIVEHLATLIPSGATLQLGLGKIPAQLLQALHTHTELRLHTGMISDAVLDLAAAGALHRERPMLTAVAVGSASFYARLTTTQGLAFAEVAHTHAQLYAINSALEVDLLGQVNAEMLDGRYLSGPGGLPDFAHAAHLNSDGLSIIALNATDGSGARSRIVPRLAAGTPVTVPQHDVDVIVTEYGAALLRGQPLDERMRRLCAIAHPQHRPALQQAARELLR